MGFDVRGLEATPVEELIGFSPRTAFAQIIEDFLLR